MPRAIRRAPLHKIFFSKIKKSKFTYHVDVRTTCTRICRRLFLIGLALGICPKLGTSLASIYLAISGIAGSAGSSMKKANGTVGQC